MLLGEVAAPVAPALGALVELAVLFFCFALTWLVRILVVALLGWLIDTLASIPGIGGYLAYPFVKIEQAVAYALGKAEHAIDAAIGASWHLLARYMEWLWREIRGNGVLMLEMATSIYPLVVAYHVLRALLHHQSVASGVTAARVKTLEREYTGIDKQLRTLEREYHGIDAIHVGKRLGAIEHDLGRIESQTIPAIRAADDQAASAISNLYEWAKGKASLLGVGTFSLAVAAALEALGLGNLRCPSFLKNLNRRGCGMWNGIEDVLGLFVDLFIITDLCDVIPLLETAYGDVAAPAVAALTEAIDAMPCVAGNQPPPLDVPRLHLPANPSLALALP